MKIVVDTNILMSGIFFGGYPGKIVEAVLSESVTASVTPEIVREYMQTVEKLIQKGAGHFTASVLYSFIGKAELVDSLSSVCVCRDPDDDKFLACAKDSNSIYIVSGDKDLLDLKKFENISIISAKQFCDICL